MSEYVCAEPSCRMKFQAREADRRRGWARFCSKSCKAKKQTRDRSHRMPTHVTPDFEAMS
jgi:hypothetical protein